MKRSKVFLFGDINLDVSMPIPAIPKPGQDVYVDDLFINLGGSSTNTAVTLQQLGITSQLLGSIGTDPYSDFLLDTLNLFDLDTSCIRRNAASPSGQIFLTVLPDGERTMYSYRGANVLTTPADIPQNWSKTIDLVHLSGYVFLKDPQRQTAIQLIQSARQERIPVSLDTGRDPVIQAASEIRSILSNIDICICGQDEGHLLTGCEKPDNIIKAFFDLGIKCSAVKLGAQGCMIGLNEEIYSSPSLTIQVKDTTGSGDAFSAGVLIAWLNNYSLSEMGILANSLGAYIATKTGSISMQLTWTSFVEFLDDVNSNQTMQMKANISALKQRLGICTK